MYNAALLLRSVGSGQRGCCNRGRSGPSGLIYGQISLLMLAFRSLYHGSQSSERVRMVFVLVDAMITRRIDNNRSNCGEKWMIIDNVITGLYDHSGLITIR